MDSQAAAIKMGDVLKHLASLSIGEKLAFAALGILAIHGAIRLLETTLPRYFQQADARYRVRKLVVFLGYCVGFLFLVTLFEDRLGRISLAVGVAGAGVVVALQDVIASFGGWFAISASKLYAVGDRIQIGDTRGDVIDISILRTTVLEVGNWVSGDLHNGRVARIPNHLVLKGPVFNYTQSFRFVWDEIKVALTTHSDHSLARTMLLEIAQETTADFMQEAQRAWKRVTDDYEIENPRLDHVVALAVNGGSLEFTVSYIVDYAHRTDMKDRLFTKIADQVASSRGRLQWASASNSSSSSLTAAQDSVAEAAAKQGRPSDRPTPASVELRGLRRKPRPYRSTIFEKARSSHPLSDQSEIRAPVAL